MDIVFDKFKYKGTYMMHKSHMTRNEKSHNKSLPKISMYFTTTNHTISIWFILARFGVSQWFLRDDDVDVHIHYNEECVREKVGYNSLSIILYKKPRSYINRHRPTLTHARTHARHVILSHNITMGLDARTYIVHIIL